MQALGLSADSRSPETGARSGAGLGGALPSRTLDRGSPLLWVAAVATVLMAHAAAFYAMTRESDDPLAGNGGQIVDAISVTLVAGDVLETRDPQTVPVPASAAASV